ncbi:MAG TPA: Ig-like domain-containing protein, partial [Methanomassiliicoccales archaeon]|nr:Ig-like domain-containing protein [Methanomassiliicoccales archaeon]
VADAVSGVAAIYVKLDNAADYTFIMLNRTQLFTGLSEGAHTITIRAVDNVGNERVASQTFTIDLTPPTIVSTLPTGVNIAASPGAIKVSFSEKMLRSSAKITINGNATTAPNPQWSNGDKNATWTLASFAYAKNYTITVTAQDLAGNRLTGTRTFSFSTICQIVGNIDDQMGNSITGARVTLMRNGLAIANATTDPNGNFNFAVAPGNYSIEVSKSDYNSLSDSLTVALGTRNSFGILTLTLAPNYSLPLTLFVVIIVVVGVYFVLSRRKK